MHETLAMELADLDSSMSMAPWWAKLGRFGWLRGNAEMDRRVVMEESLSDPELQRHLLRRSLKSSTVAG